MTHYFSNTLCHFSSLRHLPTFCFTWPYPSLTSHLFLYTTLLVIYQCGYIKHHMTIEAILNMCFSRFVNKHKLNLFQGSVTEIRPVYKYVYVLGTDELPYFLKECFIILYKKAIWCFIFSVQVQNISLYFCFCAQFISQLSLEYSLASGFIFIVCV